MKSKYGLPEKALEEIRKRDQHCVYCKVYMPKWADRTNDSDYATIEHLYPPGNDPTWVAFCCQACNASHKMPLREWFKTDYCLSKNINEDTVAEPIKRFLSSGLREYDQIWLDGTEHDFLHDAHWSSATTMPEIPHEYVVRDRLSERDQRSFDKIARQIDKGGYFATFEGRRYKYGKYRNYKYWVIGNILNRDRIG
jgi:hypothetical protein